MPHTRAIVISVLCLLAALPAVAQAATQARHSLREPVSDEHFYFVMADRFENGDTGNDLGGLRADREVSGFDPTHKGYYHGGDLKGLTSRIDYIRRMGTTSIWLTPSFKNKAVQPEDKSAGYHGYWITDFTQIDPHLGSNDDLRALIDAAHARGMKVYFDIITNHTADAIGYEGGARKPYVSKDAVPYKDAAGNPFDDRDFAGGSTFPPLDPAVSFPYKPVLEPGEEDLKVPAWLNDVTLYHNRGDSTFTGEDSLYGDFFGLDGLFTEHPKVVDGFIDVYQTWIRDFGVDGFRIDTMKHVDDAFWQRFGPEVLRYARAQGKREFFMFGEVFDTSKPYLSRFTTQLRQQAVLDFAFQAAAQGFAAESEPTDALRDFFADDDMFIDADSNAYQLPTFLGNHDMGRIGNFITKANPDAADAERLARDRLAHELMFFSRGNPVIYYGDEQGFVGDGGDQDARQDMFPGQVATYNDDDLIGTDATTAEANFDPQHPLYRGIRGLSALTKRHRALRTGAHQHRWSSSGPGIYAFSRIDRGARREYVVALNNAETSQVASVPTWAGRQWFGKLYGEGARRVRADRSGRLQVSLPPLSAAVYRLDGRMPRSRRAPWVALRAPVPGARALVQADVGGDNFYEVTFLARTPGGDWTPIGTDDTAPYRVFHDTSGLAPGTNVRYRAVVLDNAGHTATSTSRGAAVLAPELTWEAPAAGAKLRGKVTVRAVADPERGSHVVAFERRVGDGAWTPIGTDDSSPAYVATDDLAPLALAPGTPLAYRATLTDASGVTSVSDVLVAEAAGPPVRTAIVNYMRPAGDFAGWGLHLFGDAIDPSVATTWDAPLAPADVIDGWARFEIPLVDDTKPVKFIVHTPSGDSVPDTREPGGDRQFVPLDSPEIWLLQGDPTVYTSPPG